MFLRNCKKKEEKKRRREEEKKRKEKKRKEKKRKEKKRKDKNKKYVITKRLRDKPKKGSSFPKKCVQLHQNKNMYA